APGTQAAARGTSLRASRTCSSDAGIENSLVSTIAGGHYGLPPGGVQPGWVTSRCTAATTVQRSIRASSGATTLEPDGRHSPHRELSPGASPGRVGRGGAALLGGRLLRLQGRLAP